MRRSSSSATASRQYIVEGRFQGQADPPLTERGAARRARRRPPGRRRTRRPALPIPDGPPLEIVHSPLARTAATAAAIAPRRSPATCRSDPTTGFLEIGQGEWEGLHRDEIVARYGEPWPTWRRRPTEAWAPGGESLAEVAARVRPALAALLGRPRRRPGRRARATATRSRATASRRPTIRGRSSSATTGCSRSPC